MLWQLIIAIDLQWGKMKLGIYCYLIADILTKVLQKCSLCGFLQNIPFCCNFLIWLVTMATKKENLHCRCSGTKGGARGGGVRIILLFFFVPIG